MPKFTQLVSSGTWVNTVTAVISLWARINALLLLCVSVHSMVLTLHAHVYNSPCLSFTHFAAISSSARSHVGFMWWALHQARTFLLDSLLATAPSTWHHGACVKPLTLCMQTQNHLICKEKNAVAKKPGREGSWERLLRTRRFFCSCFSSFLRPSCTARI